MIDIPPACVRYEARQLPDSKWAVFLGDEQHTKGGKEEAARNLANFMNRVTGK